MPIADECLVVSTGAAPVVVVPPGAAVSKSNAEVNNKSQFMVLFFWIQYAPAVVTGASVPRVVAIVVA